MISTRNRCAELERTCSKLTQLKPGPEEVVICADGCTDGTVEMLQARFPGFRVLANASPFGSTYSRSRMLQVARGDIVVSLDDDSYPVQTDFVKRVKLSFEQHPEVAVIVFAELRNDSPEDFPGECDGGRGYYVSAYANCGAAMRREFYLTQPGFPEFFTHMYEEPDYALQCYAAGSAVWLEPCIAVFHWVCSKNRHEVRRHLLNARNELWSVWLRCPWPWLVPVSAYRVVRQLVYAWSQGFQWVLREPGWWFGAGKGITRCWQARCPIPWRIYYQWMRLARHPISTLEQLRQTFPLQCQDKRNLLSRSKGDRCEIPRFTASS